MTEASTPQLAAAALGPIVLTANTPGDRPYRGGEGIARFRGIVLPDEWRPEDFVGSTTEVYSGGGIGLTRLPNGELLRDAIQRDPIGWLGDDHARRWGSDTRLLVKLLDTRERLFVHFHPDQAFAKQKLQRHSGKTEAWVITSVDGDGDVWLGFNRDVHRAEIVQWFESQDTDAMLGAMNRIAVRPGDSIFVPASVPHAIGVGITLVELQQPVDLSLILEWRGFNGLSQGSATLGLGIGSALDGLDRKVLTAGRLHELRTGRPGDQVRWPFPQDADQYFRAEIVDIHGIVLLDASFSIFVVVSGSGTLTTVGTSLGLVAGMTVLVPFGAGAVRVEGTAEIIRARPPQPLSSDP